MPIRAKCTARAVLFTVGFVALGAGPALADVTDGDHSVFGGNQVNAPVSAPINADGNAVAVIGRAAAGSVGGATVHSGYGGGYGGGRQTSGDHSIGGGNQIDAPVSAPVNACGNALAIFGRSMAGCEGGAKVVGGSSAGGDGRTSGRGSVLGGNQIDTPVSAPVNACGNTAAVLGRAVAGCEGGTKVKPGGHGDGYGGGRRTSGDHSVGGGNQVKAPISVPVDICGNAVGNAVAGCEGGAKVVGGNGVGGGGRTSGDHSVGGGNQVDAPVTAPVNVCGNAAAVLGDAAAGCEGVIPPVRGGAGTGRTSGRHGVAGGNQIHVPVSVPANICGNAAAVIGRAVAGCEGGAKVEPGGHDGGYGGGDHCASPYLGTSSQAPLSELPQLPGTAESRSGAVTANPAAMPAFPRLRFHPLRHRHAPAETGLPSVPELPASVPVTPARQATALPVGSRPADLAGRIPSAFDPTGRIPGALPQPPKPIVIGGPVRTAQAGSDARALPDLPSVPVVRPVPQAGSVLPVHGRFGLPAVGGPPKRIPPMRTVAAQEPSQVQGGALVALALAALLAASSGVISMVRRLRDR